MWGLRPGQSLSSNEKLVESRVLELTKLQNGREELRWVQAARSFRTCALQIGGALMLYWVSMGSALFHALDWAQVPV